MSQPAGIRAPLLLAAALAACARTAVEGPLAVADPAADFGTVFEGRVLEHAFEVAVRAPLAVTAARTDCGCTLAELEREGGTASGRYELGEPLQPGERLRVRARYDTRGRRGPSVRAITLTTSLGTPLALTLAADVRPWLLAEPAELEHARVLEGATATRAFRVRSASGERFGLRATRAALAPWVDVALRPDGPDGAERAAGWEVAVELRSDAPRGRYSYPIELESDVPVPGQPERRFTVAPGWTLEVVGPVALSSPTLDFGVVDAAETVARTVRLDSFDPEFSAGAALPLARTARVHARADGSACEIELVLAGLDPEVAGTFLARLVVETGHPDLPRLDALVRGVRAPDARSAASPGPSGAPR